MREDGEELDPRREHGVPALLLDPQRHFVLGADPGFRLQSYLFALTLSLSKPAHVNPCIVFLMFYLRAFVV